MSAAVACSGCEGPARPLGGFITCMGRMGPLCERCAQRCDDSTVFRRLVAQAVALGRTLPEVERDFARWGLPLPTTPAGVRSVAAELVRRAEAAGGSIGSVDDVHAALLRGGAPL